MSIRAIEAVVDLIEMGGVVGQADIVKCLRSALAEVEKQEPTREMLVAVSAQFDSDRALGIGFNPQTLCRAMLQAAHKPAKES